MEKITEVERLHFLLLDMNCELYLTDNLFFKRNLNIHNLTVRQKHLLKAIEKINGELDTIKNPKGIGNKMKDEFIILIKESLDISERLLIVNVKIEQFQNSISKNELNKLFGDKEVSELMEKFCKIF